MADVEKEDMVRLSIMKKICLSNHIKKEYVMSLIIKRGYQETNQNSLTYCLIDKSNMSAFYNQDFIHPSCFKKGRYIGIFAGGIPVGFLGIVLMGESAAFFHVKKSDMCLHNLFVFPKWRGKGIMGNAISHCICQYFSEDKDVMRVSLCVRKDNASALRCYTKFGFHQHGEIKVIRLFRDYYMFPKRTI